MKIRTINKFFKRYNAGFFLFAFLLLLLFSLFKSINQKTGLQLLFTSTNFQYLNLTVFIFFGAVLIFLLYLIRRYEINRIKLGTQLKLEKVETDSLRELDQLKSQFFANISHEFRTPLTLILGQIESVMLSGIEEGEKSKLQVAGRNARRLLTLINQLLDLSKLEAGNMELNVSQHNIVSFLKSLFFSFESLANVQKINLVFESESANIQVVFDLDKMEKVFYNLVSNAVKFSKKSGNVKIAIKTIDSQLVEIQISDDGLGIPAEQISRIFDRFFQVDSSSTRNYEGTGIGLALVKELVELHRGKITVNSIDGEGSVFTLVLPVGDVKQEIKTGDIGISGDIGASLTNSETEFYENKYITSKTGKPAIDEREIVLVVEDNIEIRQYIREQLEEFYNVLEAENGSEGMEVALKIVPDLIVSDLMMPKVNGFQFCKAIRNNEQTSHIPIVILTAKAGFDSKIAGFENGVDDFIVKPFSARELKVRVRNLINQRKLLRTRFKSATVIRPSEVTAVSIDQLFLGKIIKLIEANFENQNFTPELLAGSVNMSVSQLNRKLNALIEQPAGQLMRSLRLQRAADLLKLKAGTISEICYLLDFNDPAYFSRAFKKQFGCSPSEFAKN